MRKIAIPNDVVDDIAEAWISYRNQSGLPDMDAGTPVDLVPFITDEFPDEGQQYGSDNLAEQVVEVLGSYKGDEGWFDDDAVGLPPGSYDRMAIVEDENGIGYLISCRTGDSEEQILDAASKFYDVTMARVVRVRNVGYGP